CGVALLSSYLTISSNNQTVTRGTTQNLKSTKKNTHKSKVSSRQTHKCVGTIEILVIASALTQPTEPTNTIDLSQSLSVKHTITKSVFLEQHCSMKRLQSHPNCYFQHFWNAWTGINQN
ncbi:hypothetical protein LINPERPRIM_LOCUS16726, partial [Linum perenne]